MGRKDKEVDSPLRAHRQERRVSLTEMAKRANYRLNYLSAIETGRQTVTRPVVEKYEQVLSLAAGTLTRLYWESPTDDAEASEEAALQPSRVEDITILEPRSGARIPSGEWRAVRGRSHNVWTDLHIWLIVVDEFGLLWPQQRVLFDEGTSWIAWVRFGAGDEDRDKSCRVVAVLADEESQRQFEEYLVHGAEAGHRYVPFRTLPRGANEKASITVRLI